MGGLKSKSDWQLHCHCDRALRPRPATAPWLLAAHCHATGCALPRLTATATATYSGHGTADAAPRSAGSRCCKRRSRNETAGLVGPPAINGLDGPNPSNYTGISCQKKQHNLQVECYICSDRGKYLVTCYSLKAALAARAEHFQECHPGMDPAHHDNDIQKRYKLRSDASALAILALQEARYSSTDD